MVSCGCASVCMSMSHKLGEIESALTLCLHRPAINGDKGPASSTPQLDDVTAHVTRHLGEARHLQQERLLGLHGGLGAAAVAHRHHVVGLAGHVAACTRLLVGERRRGSKVNAGQRCLNLMVN